MAQGHFRARGAQSLTQLTHLRDGAFLLRCGRARFGAVCHRDGSGRGGKRGGSGGCGLSGGRSGSGRSGRRFGQHCC
ncbi:MAG: hypothetical protein CVT75_08525 [Alphaproteobacteria bacterium HGW-Alphaproteobacteria-14]|nr:MAG: hypothetical protein CVT75_08525 [Alphaproteobacteria bacterium HGW-Alphaproteobacteria-14]